jgi:hypothetical protein
MEMTDKKTEEMIKILEKDIFRKNYHTLSKANQDFILEIKNQAQLLHNSMDFINNREMRIAKTNLEQAIMWATKAVVLADEAAYTNPKEL